MPFIHYGQSNLSFPKDFTEAKIPQTYSDEWYLLIKASNSYSVSADRGSLIIRKAQVVNHCGLRIPGGTLIGINDGEFGGGLFFNDIDSTKKPVYIKYGNIKFLFVNKNKIYFIEAFAHMSFSYGALYELIRKDDKFTYTELLAFDDAPEAFTIYRDKFLIATHSGFCIVRNFKKELVINDTFWNNLYPNSVAVLNNKNVLIGIRGGIVNVNLSDRKIKFYKYNK
jgi:hypothetical protein